MKINMQDYRHAVDRVHIAEHCKEEVISMTATQKRNGRPIIRIVTGITAAAACLAVAGTLGYSFITAKQDNTLIPAAAPNISAQLEEQRTKPAEKTSAAAAPETDDREFPVFSRMPEDKRTKTFDWGTIRLDSLVVSHFGENDQDSQYIGFQFDVHLNDDIDITEADAFSVEWNCFMYDTAMEHKIIQNNPTTMYLKDFDDVRNFSINLYCFIPKEASANCLTKDETGGYREIYSDFLEKQPFPDYLLYELEITKVSIGTAHYGDNDEVREVLLSEKTPMFKFRPEDAPADQEEIVDIKNDSQTDAYGIEEDIPETLTTEQETEPVTAADSLGEELGIEESIG